VPKAENTSPAPAITSFLVLAGSLFPISALLASGWFLPAHHGLALVRYGLSQQHRPSTSGVQLGHCLAYRRRRSLAVALIW
jgi:hypothetical protein